MKKTTIIIAAIIMMAGFKTKSMAQITKTTTVGAKILTALTVTQNSVMNFGAMGVLAGLGGTCVLSTDGLTRSATAGVTLSNLAPAKLWAKYTVTGEPLYTYAITLPEDGDVILDHATDGSAHMGVTAWKAKSTSGTDSHTATGTLVAGTGTEDFTIGATLNVSAAQLPGVYSKTFNVTVAYN